VGGGVVWGGGCLFLGVLLFSCGLFSCPLPLRPYASPSQTIMPCCLPRCVRILLKTYLFFVPRNFRGSNIHPHISPCAPPAGHPPCEFIPPSRSSPNAATPLHFSRPLLNIPSHMKMPFPSLPLPAIPCFSSDFSHVPFCRQPQVIFLRFPLPYLTPRGYCPFLYSIRPLSPPTLFCSSPLPFVPTLPVLLVIHSHSALPPCSFDQKAAATSFLFSPFTALVLFRLLGSFPCTSLVWMFRLSFSLRAHGFYSFFPNFFATGGRPEVFFVTQCPSFPVHALLPRWVKSLEPFAV